MFYLGVKQAPVFASCVIHLICTKYLECYHVIFRRSVSLFRKVASGTMGVCLRGVRRPGRPKFKLTVEDATLSFWGVRTPTGDPGAISGRPASVLHAVSTPLAPWVPRVSFAKVWHLGACRGPWDVGFLFLM